MNPTTSFNIDYKNVKYDKPVLLTTTTPGVAYPSLNNFPPGYSIIVANNADKKLNVCIPDIASPSFIKYVLDTEPGANTSSYTSYLLLTVTKGSPSSVPPTFAFTPLRLHPDVSISGDSSSIFVSNPKSYTYVVCSTEPTIAGVGGAPANSEYFIRSTGVNGATFFRSLGGATSTNTTQCYRYDAYLVIENPYNAATPGFIAITMEEGVVFPFPAGNTTMLVSVELI